MFRVGAGVRGDAKQLRFLLRGEMHFHAPNIRVLLSCVNSLSSELP
jgi:hypothetical protein